MILGMPVATFTVVHTIISLIGIVTGFVVAFGMLGNNRLSGWTAAFLISTVATSVTGFMFPLTKIGPPHIFGVISLVVLAIALFALYGRNLAGSWRWLYVVGAVFALYLNSVVGVVQTFQKIPFFNALAPKGNEPAVLVAQLLLLALLAVLGIRALKRFHPPRGTPGIRMKV